MTWTWFDFAWPWFGSVAAALLLFLLFATDRLRGDRSLPRWRDPVWLSWLAVPIYMIHNVEEYGVDLLGRVHTFPDALCSTLGPAPYPACPVPPAFFLAVNLPLFWVAAPVIALLSPRHPFAGLAVYGLLITNSPSHIVPMLLGKGYNAGVFTATFLFLPAFAWVAYACFGPGQMSRLRGLPVLIGAGVLVHVVLLGSLVAFLHGAIGATLLLCLQLINAVVFVSIPLTAERFMTVRRLAQPIGRA